MMKLTKYGHACFTLEKDGKVLVVDPGGISPDFIVPEHVVAIVVTHEHADHFDPDVLAAIYDLNPTSILISTSEVITHMPDHEGHIAEPNESFTVGPFELQFTGGTHAVIYPTIPLINNFGVMINHRLYYPGDSFAPAPETVDVLALPVSAPWLKFSEAIDFMIATKPRLVFPTHDAIYSSAGNGIVDRLVPLLASPYAITYQRLDGSIEI
jgi:L-ascorbate metabolism protein UlaG (beta-lactamase superfamily)